MANTTTYEEERKRPELQKPQTYDYAAPQGTYYGEQGNAATDAYNTVLQRYAQAADPQRQAEQDARIRRGREFWTGAGLFANVVANAINANGTARNAPNMTWNNDMEKNMYASWKEADRQLKADRNAANERYNALLLQDASMRAAAGEKRAAEAKAAFDINFQNEQAYQKAQNDAAQKDWEWERQQAADAAKTKAAQEFQHQERLAGQAHAAQMQKNSFEQQTTLAETKAQQAKGYNKGNKTVRIGNVDFKAETEDQADSNIAQVYGMVLDAYNKGRSALERQAYQSKPEEQYSFINSRINTLLATDAQFKAEYEKFLEDHKRSIARNYGSGAAQSSTTMPGVSGSASSTTMPGVQQR